MERLVAFMEEGCSIRHTCDMCTDFINSLLLEGSPFKIMINYAGFKNSCHIILYSGQIPNSAEFAQLNPYPTLLSLLLH
jgi:hypothetical protein